MRIYRTTHAVMVEEDGKWYALHGVSWDELVNRGNLGKSLREPIGKMTPELAEGQLLAPLGSQEVWAAGVTYLRSRDARMEESKGGGASNFYDRVYEADRPELFFKCAGHRVVGHGGAVRLRRDSKWVVPEPELAVLVNSSRQIVGYTIGNDMSCRDIEGENPLYLPQAKMYDGSCALGPGVLIAEGALSREMEIAMTVKREGMEVFAGATRISQMKRGLEELVEWLYREQSFPSGCYLLTGTGIVPPNDFSLVVGDEIRIRIEGIGELVNIVRG